jgi:hypothetical protein
MYESDTKEDYFKNKHLRVLKSTDLGVTEMMLRMIAWLCTKDDHVVNAQICIVTGPNQDIAIREKFDKLIISLKTAVVNEYSLDKEATSYNDLLDGLRLSLKAYNIN